VRSVKVVYFIYCHIGIHRINVKLRTLELYNGPGTGNINCHAIKSLLILEI